MPATEQYENKHSKLYLHQFIAILMPVIIDGWFLLVSPVDKVTEIAILASSLRDRDVGG